MKPTLLCLSLLLIASTTAYGQTDAFLKIIYGNDDRVEASQYPDAKMRTLSKSVAGMVFRSRLSADRQNPELLNFPKITAQNALGLCEDERFADQIILPGCTGFLVKPDVVVTAGHCIEEENACARTAWVFDYIEGTEKLKKSNVYNCKNVIESKLETTFGKILDYAVIQLDRPVTDRAPLRYRKSGRAWLGKDLIVAGHPSGLPLKIADQANITRMNKDELKNLISTLLRKRYYFIANLDTYGGNSGSPVFDAETLLVEGLLIEGAEDYVFDEERGCLRSNRRSNKRWTTEEKVFRITKIKSLQ
jgi:V8-like Glu-specific endopeptidase